MLGFLESPKTPKSNSITLQQDNHDKLTVVTDKETIVKVCKKLFRWRKNEYERFTQLGSADYDRVIYQIYQHNNWNTKI